MSGIAGILSLDHGTVEADQAERMAGPLAWRGRGDDGSYRSPDGRLALAARCPDSPEGTQPLANETHDVWLVLDGDILNYRTLRHSLEWAGHRFRTTLPAEVALHAYEQWELDFPAHLQGSFALALWDDRRDRLVLARDRMGRKPLYVASHRGRLAFASGIVPVTQGLGLPRRLDPVALGCLLALGHIPAPRTIAGGVSKLKAGEMLVAGRGSPVRRFQWGLAVPDERKAAAVRSMPLERHAGNLRTLLECAVADRLMGGTSIGIRLNGSPEAGALAAIAGRLAGRPAQAVAVVDADEADGERARDLRRMAGAARAELCEVAVGGEDALAALPAIVRALAEPVADTELVPAWFAAQAGAAAGLDSLVGAEGAATVLLTHPAFKAGRQSELAFRLRRLMPGLWRPRRHKAASPPAALVPFAAAEWSAILDPGIALPPVAAPETAAPAWAQGDELEIIGLTDLAGRVCDGLVPSADSMAQAHGLEAHLPFLDDPYVAYALAVPGIFRSPAGAPSQIARRAMGDLLPLGMMARAGQSGPGPLAGWLAGPAGIALAESVAASALARAGILSAQAAPLLRTSGMPALWLAAVLAAWAEAHGFTEMADAPSAAHLATESAALNGD